MGKFQYRKFQAFDEDHSTEVLPQKEEKNQDKKSTAEEISKEEITEKEEVTPSETKPVELEIEEKASEKTEQQKDDLEETQNLQKGIKEDNKIENQEEQEVQVNEKLEQEETISKEEKEDQKETGEKAKEDSQEVSQEEHHEETKEEKDDSKKELLKLELTTSVEETTEEKEKDLDTSNYAVPFLEKLKVQKEKKKLNPKKSKKTKKAKKPKTEKRIYMTKEMWELLWRLGVLILGCLLVIVGTLYWISPLNTLQGITVEGNQQLIKENVVQTSGLKKNQALWPQVFKKNQVANKLKKEYPEIKNVTISFHPMNHLAIEMKEYPVDALLKEGTKYYPILENGYVRKAHEVSSKGDYPVLVDFKNKNDILRFLKIYHQLPQEIVELIEEIHFTGMKNDPNQLTLNMSDGNQVIARMSTLIQYLPKYPQVASQMKEKGIVDMEAGVFSYPYGNEERNKEKKEKDPSANENKTAPNGDEKEEKKENSGGDFIPDITQLPGQKENH